MPLPLIAIVGIPNVGKSTLFNRLVGRRRAIVTDRPGVTRDRIYGEVQRGDRSFRLVDTGGLTLEHPRLPLAEAMERQVERAMREAVGVLLVLDARAGLTAADRDVAALLRRRGLRVIVVANKVDDERRESAALEAHELGLGEPVAVSAEHGLGIDGLLERIDELLDCAPREGMGVPAVEGGAPPVGVAIVGRPNVGKSSILNALLGDERSLVCEIPGTTRDAVDTMVERGGHRYLLVDTAGLRRRGKLREIADVLSETRTRQSIERCDVVVLVLDAAEGFVAQDAHIAGFAAEASKPMVVAVNKWDRIRAREEQAREWEREVRARLRFARDLPVTFVSARTGQRVTRILDLVDELHRQGGIHVSTPELNRWLHHVAEEERSAPARGRSIRLLYATQAGVHPPRFILFCNDARKVHFSLRRHLEGSLRDRFGFGPVPIRLRFRSRRERAEP